MANFTLRDAIVVKQCTVNDYGQEPYLQIAQSEEQTLESLQMTISSGSCEILYQMYGFQSLEQIIRKTATELQSLQMTTS